MVARILFFFSCCLLVVRCNLMVCTTTTIHFHDHVAAMCVKPFFFLQHVSSFEWRSATEWAW